MAEGSDSGDDWDMDEVIAKKASAKSNKKLSVERIYQKKTQLEHILIRPDTYIGSVEPVTQTMWVMDDDKLVNRTVTFVPGLYKIFDEILVNAADNKQRDPKMDCIKIEINPDRNKISVWNNGAGIPVVEHKDEKMFVPTMIFGHLLTSSNYNDEEKKVTGGRNGYGAKLCNIFSTKFTVETAAKQYNKQFKQTWENNMGKTKDPDIVPYKGTDFTCVTFYPDLTKFKMESLEKDIVAIMTRRAYDVAGCTKGVKVYLNGKRLPVKGFKDYIEMYLEGRQNEIGDPLKIVHEIVSDRWEIAVTTSDQGFQQVSFVNSIATTKGGRHVDYITDQLTAKIAEVVKKKNKGGKGVRPFQIKTHLWIFLNCLIENPTFDSQTKENMTLQLKSFGSKCQLTEKFVNSTLKCGIVEAIMSWVKYKEKELLEKKCSGKKQNKLKGVPKLEDANDAGTRNSIDCTLILTEGDSAKSLAVSGLGVVGRDKFGVFPLRGKLLNVREATHKQILENAEINNVIKIMGLQYKKKYETVDDLKTLRYGRLMIMTDQDQDGSHIKGLVINFIHHNWPGLLRLPFLEEFITPIVKASKGKNESISFYSLPEFEEWKTNCPNWSKYKIKYYKGLGTSTSMEAKEYFSDMVRHRIKFNYTGTEDDNAIQLAFSKKMVDMRKEWLTNGMEERKRRRELGLPELYLYGKHTTAVSYNDFVNKELILFSNMDNERSIPSLVDGLKPGQRKVLYTCRKRNDKNEVKVAQLVGSVAEQSAYHHGEQSLAGTIINMAQNFIGSNNINLLLPIGQFGTRLQGGKDAASPRYIFTKMNDVTKHLFSALDDPLYTYLYDDNLKIEPEYYLPIIPTVLVNGGEGIGTGWSTKILNYNPRDLVKNLKLMMEGREPSEMLPWFKNFRGTIDRIDAQHFVCSGEVALLENNRIEITELPVRTWTQAYKESVLEPMLHGTEKTPSFINDYKEYHTDTTVRFVVTLSAEKLSQAMSQGLHKVFKLQTALSSTQMVLFDHNGCLRKFDSPEQILREFYDIRLELYEKRKEYYVGILGAESLRLKNQARFIVEKIENKITIENRKRADMIKTLQEKRYDSDPVKAWKKMQKNDDEEKNDRNDSDEENGDDGSSGPDYDYLLGMTLWSLTREKKDELLKKRDEKIKELEDLKSKTPMNLWKTDLDEFLEALGKQEKEEAAQEAGEVKLKGKMASQLPKKKKVTAAEYKPSAFGERITPQLDDDMKKRFEKKPLVPGEKKGRKKKSEVVVKDDGEEGSKPRPLAERIGVKDGPKKKDKLKQTTLNFLGEKKTKKATKSPKKGPKKNPWSDSESGSNDSDMSDVDVNAEDYIPPEKRAVGQRRAAANVKFSFGSEEEKSGGDDNDDDDDEPVVKKKPAAKVNGNRALSPAPSESDDSFTPQTNDVKSRSNDDLFNSLLGSNDGSPPAKSSSPVRKSDSSGSDSDAGFQIEAKKPAAKKPAPKKRPKGSDDSSSEDDFKPKPKKKPAAPKEKKAAPKKNADGPKKQAKPKPKKFSDSEDDAMSEDDPTPKKKPKPKSKPKKMGSDSDAMSEDGYAPKKTKTKPKKKAVSSSDGGMSEDEYVPKAREGGRGKAAVKYNFGSDSESD